MVRKLYLIAGLYAVCVIGAVLSGCSIYDKEDVSKMIATPGDAECQADGAKNGEGDAEGKEKSGDKTEDAESNTDTDGESQGEDMTRLRDYSIVCTDRKKRKRIGQKKTGSSCTICKGIWCGNRNDTWGKCSGTDRGICTFIECHKNRDRTKQCKEKSLFQQTDINREVDRGCS